MTRESPQLLALASAILEQPWARMTLVHTGSSDTSVVSQVVSHSNCSMVAPQLSLTTLQLREAHDCEPYAPCEGFELVTQQLSTYFQDDPPQVVLSDFSVGALLWSELKNIPTIVVSSETYPWMQHPTHGGWWQRLGQWIYQRWTSWMLTRPYMELNHIRRSLGLPLMRELTDVLEPVVSIWMEFCNIQEFSAVQALGVLQTSCIPCVPPDRHNSRSDVPSQRPVLLLELPSTQTPRSTRNILQALVLARASLQEYDSCLWDALECRTPAPFDVIWLTPNTLPPIYPDFVHPEDTMLMLDALAWFPRTSLALMPCHGHSVSSVVEHVLGTPVLCLDTAPHTYGDTRALAAHILRLLRPSSRHATTSTTVPSTPFTPLELDGLSQAMTMIYHISNDPANYTSINSPSFPDQPYDAFTELMAWMIILLALSYLLIYQILFPSTPSTSNSNSSSPLVARWVRWSELDDIWNGCRDWLRQFQQDHPIVRMSWWWTAPEPTPPPAPTTTGRRRKKR